ncbi:MAG TPA: DMT family transporter [Pseudolabrys sp.]|nr:DMT family transporter [Pseudolabrys sp.]
MSSTSREKLGVALGLAGVLLFGGTLPATRVAVQSIDPLFLSAARAAIAGCTGVLLLLVLRRPLPPLWMWADILLAGLCTIIGFPVFMALAMTYVPSSHGGVVLGILPLATVAAAAIVTHERPSVGFWIASVAGATIVLVFMMRHSDSNSVEVGDLFLIGTVVSGAFGYAFSGRLSAHRPGWEVISWQVAAFLPLSLITTAFLWPPTLLDAPRSAWIALAYVSFISQLVAFFVFNAAMSLGGVARSGQLMLLQPFVIVTLSVPVNGERFDVSTLAYAAAVVAVVVIGQRMMVKRR